MAHRGVVVRSDRVVSAGETERIEALPNEEAARFDIVAFAVASKNAVRMQLADARCSPSALGALIAPTTISKHARPLRSTWRIDPHHLTGFDKTVLG